ncbi:Integral membrane sensor signal transduction histidine kinase [Frankia canadensis]|uniref:Signal transduction histidine-protein kinase/phosphatase MprB n=1 Tax=Frankia canadensis TaxID=1836972 RepID=A0A2I2KV94_9ACTN|nr:HAMP domain-containing sensor histidine kinase [Frankia canadensis]SNQ49574.1 Integral membrane sensor signal transduction histidine kinase [Frankia canadensis]SOU56864.1 Integral membrane sensor signal transduction histidine kinase [Frankia canadensis]
MRWALARVAVAVTTMVALAFLVPLGLLVQHSAHDRAFTRAERQAAQLGPALAITTDQDALRRAVASTADGAAGRVAVHVPARSTAGTAAGLTTVGRSRIGTAALRAVAAGGRLSVVEVAGGFAVLQPVAVDDARIAVVEVFVPAGSVDHGVATAWLVLLAVAAVLVAMSVSAADRLGTRIVSSARSLADAARELGAGDLAARAADDDPGAPPELRAAAAAFNTMARRVQLLVAAERELAADLSHRLRTPLTVLRLNIAGLDDGEAAAQTREAVARLEHEVDQIIRTARSRAEDEPEPHRCDAAEVVRDRAEFWAALADDQGRPWWLDGVERPAWVPVARAELAAALDALLGNIYRHTEEGVAYAVELHATATAVTVRIADAGPGIPDPDAALRRGAGAGGTGSTGLGLDIARRVAASTGGELTVGVSVLGGAGLDLRLRVTAPALSRPRPRRLRRLGPRRSLTAP